ncbi:Wzy polymerase domain-containing protein [Gallaecimonas sp. GXIMD1310]|uniref:PglL family O-oligosaccharyltransferase n=1 Tax=Gallaecimonas sp. GXIMD1310 TaxID=3131926 RepID=UPI003251B887
MFAVHYFQNNLGGYGLQLSFNNTVWMAALLVVGVGIFQGVNCGQWQLPGYWKDYPLLFAALFIPLLWSGDTAIYAVGRFFAVLAGLMFLLALFQSFDGERDERSLLFIVVLSVLIEASLGALQLTGWQWLPGGRVSETGIRPQGIFQQPNVYASFLATGMMAALWLLAKHKLPASPVRKVAWLAVLFATLGLAAFGQYVTVSRTGVLASAGGLLLLLLAFRGQHRRVLFFGVLLLVVGELAGYLYTTFEHNVVRDASGVLESNGRSAIWTVSWQLFAHHPVTGVGLGGFEAAYADQRAMTFAQTGLLSMANVDHPHNELLFWAVEGGLLPVLAILLFAARFVWRLAHLGRNAFAYAALLLPIALHSMTEYPFYHSAIHWFTFLLLLFLVESRVAPLQQKDAALPYVWKSLTAAGLLLGSAFLLTNLQTISKLVQVSRANKVAKEGDSPLLPMRDIINPVVFQSQIEHIAMYAQFQQALKTHNRTTLQRFIDWGWQFSHSVVRADTFVNMLRAADALGDRAQYQRILKRARWLYPRNPAFEASSSEVGQKQ